MATWRPIREYILPYTAYVGGSVLVIIWTLLRFFTSRTIFDTVSQNVIVHQWLHGAMSPAKMGLTAYVPKMLLLYAPLDLMPGSPRLKLILLTLAINVLTFLLTAYAARRILSVFDVYIDTAHFLSCIWLAGIAGSVFWISFVNSRNLEVTGGMFLWLLGLQLLQRPSWRLAAGFAALASVLFFADPLQLYMSALPMVLYGFVLAVRTGYFRSLGYLIGLVITGLIVSKLLFWMTGWLLDLQFTGSGGVGQYSVSALMRGAAGALKAMAVLFAGGNDAGQIRQVINLLLAASVIGLICFCWLRTSLPRRLGVFLASIWVVDIVVYILSGQAATAGTSRYLIMLAPALMIGFGAIRLCGTPRIVSSWTVVAVFISNALLLGGSLANHWDMQFPVDKHLESTYRYVLIHPDQSAYASDDTAMPVLYYHNLPAEKLLPLGCLSGSLVKTQYSMSKAFESTATSPSRKVAIILDGTTISNKPNVCTDESISAQIGPPQQINKTDDGSIVLIYPSSALRLKY